MSNNGWVKLHRKLHKSDMYESLNSKQRDVMIQCLLLANHTEKQWEWDGKLYTCQPGEFVTSLKNLAKKCAKNTKVQSVRTALLKLEKWGFLTNKSTKTGRLIKVLKWSDYQDSGCETNNVSNKQLTNNQQTANKQLTTNKNDKRMIKNNKNDKEESAPWEKNSTIKLKTVLLKKETGMTLLPEEHILLWWNNTLVPASNNFILKCSLLTSTARERIRFFIEHEEYTIDDVNRALEVAESEVRRRSSPDASRSSQDFVKGLTIQTFFSENNFTQYLSMDL